MQFRRMLPFLSLAILLAVAASAQNSTVPGAPSSWRPDPLHKFGPPPPRSSAAQKGERIIYRPAITEMKLLTQTSGWALAGGKTIYWTDDDGAHWKDITPPNVTSGRFNTPPFASVFFFDRDTGLALASNYLKGGDFGSLDLYSTSNGGESWAKTHIAVSESDPERPFTGGSMSFADPQHGWLNMGIMSGSAFSIGELFRTSDGGQTWNRVKGDPGVGGEIRLVTAEDGWLAGGPANTELYASHDGGKSFQQVRLGAPKALGPMNYPTYTLPVFENDLHGYEAVTYAGIGEAKGIAVLFETKDGGKTWKQDGVLTNLDRVSVGVSAISTVVDSKWMIPAVPETGEPILTVLPSGGTETAQADTMVGGMSGRKISFLSPSQGWLSCSKGLLSTTDGGATWTEITPGKHPTDWFRVPKAMATPSVNPGRL
ncbi:MAG: hypothetical protein WA708_15865 [Acidobacteriaceae bacterium]